jgi:DNA (cytosine-5)-methyltransferase 1
MPEMEGDICGADRAASGGSSRSYVAGCGVRRLTPRECERLQGFPPDYTLIPIKKVKRERLFSPRAAYDYQEINGEVWQLAADGPRYKSLGNSFPVPVIHWLGERVMTQHKRLARRPAQCA